MIPKHRRSYKQETNVKLYAANGTPINTYGEKTLRVDLNLRRPYLWKFIEADVTTPILGADFLAHHHILVDLRRKQIIDGETLLQARTTEDKSNTPTITMINENIPFYDILNEFPSVTHPTALENTQVKHDVEHYIETTGPPIHCKARPLPPGKYERVKKQIEQLVELGVCRESKSNWSSPLHVVTKKNGELRLCGDYRRLNAITVPDRYPIARLQDFTYKLHGKKYFSKLDLVRAYNQVPIKDDHICKTAIITPFGLFEWCMSSYGLRNAGNTFQRLMDTALRGIDNTYCYIDDILIASENEEQHRKDMRNVLQRLDSYGLKLNIQKCVLNQSSLEYLGYQVSKDGIKPLEEKINTITNLKRPETIQDLRRFLGIMNFYRNCIPAAAHLQFLLNKCLLGARKNDKRKIIYDDEKIEAFEKCKDAIKNACTLAHPDPDAEIILHTDASDKAIGAALQQNTNEGLQPIGFFSRGLTEAQQKYATYDKELLAIYQAVKYYRNYIEGRKVIIYTDHRPLIYALKKCANSKNETPRRIRQLIYISEFCTDIRHVSGKENPVADYLSRIDQIDCPSSIDYDLLSKDQEGNQEIIDWSHENRYMKKVTFPGSNTAILCDTSDNRIRPFLTENFRELAFHTIHDIAHPGIKATRNLMRQRFFWPNMLQDTAKWTRTCVACQKSKITRHTKSPIGKFQDADRFAHVHLDYVGALETSQGYRYLLTMIDRRTNWPEAIPVYDMTAETAAKTFYNHWITRFGCPATITTDRGRNFESELFARLSKIMGIKKTRTTSYHPQANGKVERLHRTLKAAIMSRGNTTNWTEELPTVLLGIRSALREDTKTSPCQLTYGKTIKLPGEFFEKSDLPKSISNDFVDQLRQHIQDMSERQTRQNSEKTPFIHPELKDCTHVFVRIDKISKPLTRPYSGPFKVLNKHEKYFTINMDDKKETISIDRLKPAFLYAADLEIKTTNSPLPLPRNTTNIAKSQPQQNLMKQNNSQNASAYVTRFGRKIKPRVTFAKHLASIKYIT